MTKSAREHRHGRGTRLVAFVVAMLVAAVGFPALAAQPASAAQPSFASIDLTDFSAIQAPALANGAQFDFGMLSVLGAPGDPSDDNPVLTTAKPDDHKFCVPVPWLVKCSKEQVQNGVDVAKCAALFWTETDACAKTKQNVTDEYNRLKKDATTAVQNVAIGIVMNQIRKMMITSMKGWNLIILDMLMGDGNSVNNPVVDCNAATGGSATLCNEHSTSWFLKEISVMRQIGLFLLVPMLMLLVMQSIIRGSLFFMLRGFFVMLPVAVLGTVIAVTLTQLLMNVADSLSKWLAADFTSISDYGHNFNNMLDKIPLESVGFFAILWIIFFGIAAIAIFVELCLRQVGIYLVLLFLPLAFAALVWPAASKFLKRLIELLFGLIFAKPLIVAAFTLGMTSVIQGGLGLPPEAAYAEQKDAVVTIAGPSKVAVDPDAMMGSIMGGTVILISAAFAGKKVTGLVLPYDHITQPSRIFMAFQAGSMMVGAVAGRSERQRQRAQQAAQQAQLAHQTALANSQPPPSPNP